MIKKLEKINLIIIAAGIIILSGLIIYTGLYNLFSKDYTSLGDPYYTNQILAFRRAPGLIWATLIILFFVFFELIILMTKKIVYKQPNNQNSNRLSCPPKL